MHLITRQLACVLLLAPFVLNGCGGGDDGSPPSQSNTGAPPPPAGQFSRGNTATPPATGGNTVIPPTTGGNTAAPGTTTGGNTATPPATSGNTATPTTGGNTTTPPATAGNTATPPPGNSSNPPPASASRFAYVAGIGGLNALSVDSDSGKVTEIARFAGGTTPRSADVDPSDKFLYSAGAEGVYAYSIDPSTGALSEIAGSPFASSECCMVNVLVHPSGQFVYATSTAAADGGLWAYRVAAAGALVQVEGSPYQLQGEAAFTTRAFRIAIDPAGHYVFAIDCNTNRVFTLRIDPTSGALVQTGVAIAAGARACSVALDPSGTFAFVASSGDSDPQSGGVSSFRIDPANGALTQISTVAAGTYPVGVSVHPTGKFAYAVSFGSDNVNAYRIESNGALTSIGTPVKTGGSPSSINVDPTGRYAYGVAYNTISGYRIDADTGLLTEIDGSPLTIDNGQADSITFTGEL